MFLLPVTTALLLGFAALPAVQEQPQQRRAAAPGQGVVRTELRIQRVIVRVPRMVMAPASTGAALPPINWVERRTGRCVAMNSLAAVSISRPNSVDLLLTGGKRVRARLDDSCPALDFYSGLYLKRSQDGMVCADRDIIRSRSGGQCRIETFRALVPAR